MMHLTQLLLYFYQTEAFQSKKSTQIEKGVQIQSLYWFIMQEQKFKQSQFEFGKIRIDSKFESGNLEAAQMPAQNQFNLWIGSDPYANYKTWFYFSIEGVQSGATVSFTIMNMNNQVKLFKEGLVPVFRTQNSNRWSRIKIPISANGIVRAETGFQVCFKHIFLQNSKHYFAFTYPWTNQQNEQMIQKLIQNASDSMFCKVQNLCLSSMGRMVKILTLTRAVKGKQLNFQMIPIMKNQIFTFPERRGIFISARVHPGETASSYIMNGLLRSLFQQTQLSRCLLENCVFYILPIINPDGVAEGNFRTDSQGKNLNRYYSNPNPESEPEIFHIKQFLVKMIKEKRISFCLDLHAHVNKQGAFIYGNSTSNLYHQTRVCLFPKLLSFINEIFDFNSCNFSEKNMSSKDKGDELSKEGASRVAIFKETGLVQCWTLECNYNSARIVQVIQQPTLENKNNNVSHGVLCSRVQPEYKQELKLLDISDFQSLGESVLEGIADFYRLKIESRVFSSKLKNMSNFEINTAISSLRLIPFRFDVECRKILDSINNSTNIKFSIEKIFAIIEAKGQKNVRPKEIANKMKSTEGTSSTGKRQISQKIGKSQQKITSLKKIQIHENKGVKTNYVSIQKAPKQNDCKIPNIPVNKNKQLKKIV